jgi:hypothetical protein
MGHDLDAPDQAHCSDSDKDNPRADGLKPSKTSLSVPDLGMDHLQS